MPRVAINITGGSYNYKSRALSNQVTRNLVPILIKDDPSVKSKYFLESFAGQKSFATQSGTARGTFVFNNVLYHVLDSILYSVSASGVYTSIGSVAGPTRCKFCVVGEKLFIATGPSAYIYDGTTLSEVSDTDYGDAYTCTSLNSRVIVDGGDNSSQFSVSDVGDPSSWNALNVGTVESDPDLLIAVESFGQRVFMFGQKTVEPWWNPAGSTDNPPFDRIEGGIIQKGLGARYSLAKNDNGMYFLSDEGRVVFFNGSVVTDISTTALNYQISTYSTIDDAYGFCMTLKGINYYVLTFPTANKTWVFPEGSQWFEWSCGVGGGKSNAFSYVRVYDKDLIEDVNTGKLYELDFETYTDAGNEIIKQRDTAPLTSEAIADGGGRELILRRLELYMETRVGDLSGEGHDPQIMLQISFDGGRTFGNEFRALIGNNNQDFIKVYWYNLGRGEEVVFRFKVSDPIFVCFHSAMLDVEFGI